MEKGSKTQLKSLPHAHVGSDYFYKLKKPYIQQVLINSVNRKNPTTNRPPDNTACHLAYFSCAPSIGLDNIHILRGVEVSEGLLDESPRAEPLPRDTLPPSFSANTGIFTAALSISFSSSSSRRSAVN